MGNCPLHAAICLVSIRVYWVIWIRAPYLWCELGNGDQFGCYVWGVLIFL